MQNIGHVGLLQWEYVYNLKYFLSRLDDVFFVGTQENLDADFVRFRELLGLPDQCNLPTSKFYQNASLKKYDKHMEPEAIANLKKWYAEDYKFLQLLRDKNLLQS